MKRVGPIVLAALLPSLAWAQSDLSASKAGGGQASAATARPYTLIYASDFGERCDGMSDNAPAYTAAAAAAVAERKTLQLGAGTCIVGSTVTIDGKFPGMQGYGESATQIVTRANIPAFLWSVNVPGVERWRIHDIAFANTLPRDPSGESYTLTRGIKVVGNNVDWFQHGTFDHLTFIGLHAGIEIAKDTYPSPFGQQSRTAFNRYDAIRIIGGVNSAKYGIYFPKGSGTGNLFSQFSGFINLVGGAYLRYEGQGAVVGDIVMQASQLGGGSAKTGAACTAISIGPGTVYRHNISFTSSDIDASCGNPLSLPTDPPVFSGLVVNGNNIGGGVAITIPPVSDSIITDKKAGRWMLGSSYPVPTTGPVSHTLFRVSLAPFTGTSCRVTVAGAVSGVGGGATTSSFLLGSSDRATTHVEVNQTSTSHSPHFFRVGFDDSDKLTSDVTVAFSPVSAGSMVDAQMECAGGTFSIVKVQ